MHKQPWHGIGKVSGSDFMEAKYVAKGENDSNSVMVGSDDKVSSKT